jgi:5,5'-dehydrodivanillate O-demethylase
MDDTHTKIFFVRFDPTEDGKAVEENGDLPADYVKPYKDPPDALHPFTRFDMTIDVQCQDHMAWETQGPISDRTRERLATADRGIVMLREMMKREIKKVKNGLDPLGVIRDAAANTMLDTKLAESLRGPEFRRELRPVGAG